jgi:hypothetical protein
MLLTSGYCPSGTACSPARLRGPGVKGDKCRLASRPRLGPAGSERSNKRRRRGRMSARLLRRGGCCSIWPRNSCSTRVSIRVSGPTANRRSMARSGWRDHRRQAVRCSIRQAPGVRAGGISHSVHTRILRRCCGVGFARATRQCYLMSGSATRSRDAPGCKPGRHLLGRTCPETCCSTR